MNPTLELLEQAFPGKGQEITDLIEKKTLATSYGSVLQYINSRQDTPPPYHICLMVAIAEVVGHIKWMPAPRVGFWYAEYALAWHFTNKCVILTNINIRN